MAKFPALPLWTDAYIADTTHLTDVEHGLYLQLLMHCWRSPGCRLPNDDDWLARKFRRPEKEIAETIRPLIEEFFSCDTNWITQKRLQTEWKRVHESSQRQRAKAKSRWNKKNDQCRGNASAAYAEAMPRSGPGHMPKELNHVSSLQNSDSDGSLKNKDKDLYRGNARPAYADQSQNSSPQNSDPDKSLQNMENSTCRGNATISISNKESPLKGKRLNTARARNDLEPPSSLDRRPVEIIAAFDDARAEMFGEEQRRPHPNASDLVYAERFSKAGITVNTAKQLFTEHQRRKKAKGEQPIGTLSYFEEPVMNAASGNGEDNAGPRCPDCDGLMEYHVSGCKPWTKPFRKDYRAWAEAGRKGDPPKIEDYEPKEGTSQ